MFDVAATIQDTLSPAAFSHPSRLTEVKIGPDSENENEVIPFLCITSSVSVGFLLVDYIFQHVKNRCVWFEAPQGSGSSS
jgi:hypothetical protein